MSKYWREEVAEQLVLAATELRERRDGSFVKSLTIAIGYLEHAARMKLSPHAMRVWDAVRDAVRETEDTAQMNLSADALETIAQFRASIAPPGQPPPDKDK